MEQLQDATTDTPTHGVGDAAAPRIQEQPAQPAGGARDPRVSPLPLPTRAQEVEGCLVTS